MPNEPLSIEPIDSQRVLRHFDELFGGSKVMPTKATIQQHRDSILTALLAKEIYEFATDPHMEKVLAGDSFLSPWVLYDKSKLH